MQQIRDGSNPDQFTNTDWAEETLRDAPMQNHYLALSGGSANTTYRFSLGYMDQGSVVIGKFHLDRYNFRANVQSRLKNWLTITKRSKERRVGKELVSTCGYRGSRIHK